MRDIVIYLAFFDDRDSGNGFTVIDGNHEKLGIERVIRELRTLGCIVYWILEGLVRVGYKEI